MQNVVSQHGVLYFLYLLLHDLLLHLPSFLSPIYVVQSPYRLLPKPSMKERRITMEQFELIEDFKRFVASAMRYAIASHETLFEDDCNISVSLAYLNAAISRFSSAEALYYAQFETLQRGEAEDLFHQFSVYANEFLNNVRTNHSHQWTDIEFNNLKDIFDSSAFAFKNLS